VEAATSKSGGKPHLCEQNCKALSSIFVNQVGDIWLNDTLTFDTVYAAGLVVCIDVPCAAVVFPVAPVVFDPVVMFLAPPALVILLCAFAMWTVYKATDPIAANSIAAVIMKTNCFCIKTFPNQYYISSVASTGSHHWYYE
jgi:hypothetical protein